MTKISRPFLTRSLLCLTLCLTTVFNCAHPATVEIYFSPKGGCIEKALFSIQAAHKSVLVEAYVLSSKPIVAALIAAKKRGVSVEVVEDARESRTEYGNPAPLILAGIPVYLDAKHPISHSKVLIIDSQQVLTGSYNWTGQAENNHENLVVINNVKIASAYAADFQSHKAHSVRAK